MGAAVALGVGVLYLPFLARLPPRTRLRLAAAGVIYLGGALVVELVDDLLVSFKVYPQRSLAHALAATLKEGLEMFGVVTYLHTLLDYVAVTLGGARVRLFRWLEIVIEPVDIPGAGERSPGSGPAGR